MGDFHILPTGGQRNQESLEENLIQNSKDSRILVKRDRGWHSEAQKYLSKGMRTGNVVCQEWHMLCFTKPQIFRGVGD